MKKSELKKIIKEEAFKLKKGYGTQDLLAQLSQAEDEDEINSIRRELKKSTGWFDSDVDYMLSKWEKDNPKYFDKP